MLELINIQIFGLDTVDKLRNEIRLSLKMSLRSFPRDKTCPRANGDVIVSPFKFYASLSCHGRQGSKIAFSFIYCQ